MAETPTLLEEQQRRQHLPITSLQVERQEMREEHDVGTEKNLLTRCWDETKKIWKIAAPVTLASVSEFSIIFVTAAYAGHLGEIEFAAVSVAQNVIEGFAFGIMLGMGSALETLSGQAVGAGRFEMLGVYLQRSFIVTVTTALCLAPFYIWASPFLKLLRQEKEISELAGKYARWSLPQLFACAISSPIQKFLQSQSKVWVMTVVTMAALLFHVLLNWILVTKLKYGLVGAAIAGDITWWLMVLGLTIYVTCGYFPDAWTGFSLMALKSLASFVKLSLASAVMICLELWYYTAIILMVGRLKNPEIAVDAISICMNLQQWTLMIVLGLHTAISVRVSNELGAGHPKAAKLSVWLSVLTSTVIGILFSVLILATENHFPRLFTDKPVVIRATSKLAYFLAATIFLNSIQAVLLGVAIGAGWQLLVALITIVCYYFIGLPVGALLGYKFKLGTNGIWLGLLFGCLFQITVVSFRMLKTNWRKQALLAENRLKTMGDAPEPQELQENPR